MSYTAKTVTELRRIGGSPMKKVASENALIDTELDTLTSSITALEAVDAAEIKVIHGDLASGNADAFAFAVQNPSAVAAHILQVVVDVTTAGGTGSSVGDVGVATSATGTGDTILDGIDLNADATYSSLSAGVSGTNATENVHRWDAAGGTNDYITGKILVANAASLAGTYTIYYKNLA